MPEKKCPHCFSEMDIRASICPACKKKVGKADRKGIAKKQFGVGKLLGVTFLLLIIMWIIGTIADNGSVKKTVHTREQKKAAAEIQQLLIDGGLVKEYKGEGKLQIVYVDSIVWNYYSFEQKKELLRQLSETNEIQGNTPYVEIKDYKTGEVFAAIKPPITFEVYK